MDLSDFFTVKRKKHDNKGHSTYHLKINEIFYIYSPAKISFIQTK